LSGHGVENSPKSLVLQESYRWFMSTVKIIFISFSFCICAVCLV